MPPERAGRYRLESTLGQGGMGAVYRAVDTAGGREVALKRLVVEKKRNEARFTALFQREYHTLVQLDHPSVIQVYDYGVDEVGPYYTMELLAGEDLRALSPLPYRRACALLHDIASSLSLLHARRLLHRDVTARNVRVIGDAHAKLMDFGALTPMGPCEEIVGTPAYIAPEAVMMQELDGRTDLYALGVLLYYALTRRVPYPARSVVGLRHAWLATPAAVHELVDGIPPALSQLTASLIALDRSARPRDAAEVMERLAAIGQLERPEPIGISRAYLTAPTLVGRRAALAQLRTQLISMLRGGGGGGCSIVGPRGVGRSRMLDASVLEAKVMGAGVLRVSPKNAAAGAFGAAHAWLQQLLELEPEVADAVVSERWPTLRVLFTGSDARARGELVDLDGSEAPRSAILSAVRELVIAVARQRALVIAVDDVHLLDEASNALLATLLDDAPRRRLLVLSTLPADAERDQPLSVRLLLQRGARCDLSPLDRRAMLALMRSIFGSVPHVEGLAEVLLRRSRGLPRDAIALAEHLVEQGAVRYRAGAWVLPARLREGVLPEGMADALRQRLSGLSARARWLAQIQTCAGRGRLQLEDLLRLDGDDAGDAREIHRALDELLAADVLASDGHGYLFKHEGWPAVLHAGMSDTERQARHTELARMHEHGAAEPLALAHHLMLSGQETRALETVERFAEKFQGQTLELFELTELDAAQVGELFAATLEASRRAGRGMRLMGRLNYFVLSIGVFVDAKWFIDLAPSVEQQLRRESGHTAWQALDAGMEPGARIMAALQAAQAAYDAAPEHERCYPPAEAIRHLTQYAVGAIAIGVRVADKELVRSLPGLLEPFAPLAPIVDAIYHNCMATAAGTYAHYECSRDLYRLVLERLSDEQVAVIEHADEIRDAVRYGIGNAKARMGIASAADWLGPIAHNPRQRQGVLSVHAILAAQRGDWAAAADFKRRAEQAIIEGEAAPMFGDASLVPALEVYALGLDLSAVKQILSGIEDNAARYPEWAPIVLRARGEYERLRGNLEPALDALRQCMETSRHVEQGLAPDEVWFGAAASAVETLLELGRPADAQRLGEEALRARPPGESAVRWHGLRRARALADAALGEVEAACAELDALIAERAAIGASGVQVGVLHEARALVAAWGGDSEATEAHLAEARLHFLACPDSGFAARYERLLELLRGAPGIAGMLDAGAERSGAEGERAAIGSTEMWVEQSLAGCADAAERAAHSLQLLGSAAGSAHGYLYLAQRSGVSCAAALSAERAPEELDAFVRALWVADEEEEEQQTMTAMLTAVALPSATTPSTCFEHAGRRYEPVWIRARLAGDTSLVGIAMLDATEPREPSAQVYELATALGTYLLRAGDAFEERAPGPTAAAQG